MRGNVPLRVWLVGARPLSYWQYGHSALCASAFQECMADFGLTR